MISIISWIFLAVSAPPQRQNDSGFSGDFNESGGDCYAAMMAAYEYYSNVLGKSWKSWW